MMDFIKQNAGTVVVGLLLLLGVIFAVIKIVKDKKSGNSCGCGGGCGGCPNSGACHLPKEEKEQ